MNNFYKISNKISAKMNFSGPKFIFAKFLKIDVKSFGI